MTLTLSNEERDVLGRRLAQLMKDLRREIDHTDDREFRTGLQHEERVLQALVARLGAGA